MTLTNLSKAQILAEKAALDGIDSSHNSAFSKSGTWGERLSRQTAWQAAHKNDNYAARRALNDSILSNQQNIDRWYLQSPEYAAIVAAEKARLTLIEKNDFIALELWTKLDNQRIANEQAEIKRLAAVKEVQRIAAEIAENQRLELIQEQKDLELKNIQIAKNVEVNRLQAIEDKEVQRVTKSIPLLVSVIPVGILAILLLNSSRGKK